ncbi:HET domain-containing protein [Paramyrothecium foliicola]|nr:HET domain-containing protein [Paramyrothecium foliicola]
MDHNNSYRYGPLPLIADTGRTPPFSRLLWLAPGFGDEPLVGQITIFNVEAAPRPYEALSYTWGTEPPSNYLWLQGYPLPIRPNLEYALTALRLPTQTRALWVDAICIDQSSNEERSRQVGYMRMIYKYAARVIAWVGPRSPGVGHVFEMMRRLSAAAGFEGEQWRQASRTMNMDVAHELYQVAGQMPPGTLRLVEAFWQRPYFTRCWCIQEIAASQRSILKCDEFEIPFTVAAGCLLPLGEFRTTISYNNTSTLWFSIWRSKQEKPDAHNFQPEGSMGGLLSLLDETRAFQATDTRDKLFSLYGISNEGLSPAMALTQTLGSGGSRWLSMVQRGLTYMTEKVNNVGPGIDFLRHKALKVNYDKPEVDVFIDLTRFMLQRTPHILDILDHVSHLAEPDATDYPSWVPRWSDPKLIQVMKGRIFRAGFVPGGTVRLFAEIHDNALGRDPQNSRVLALDGFLVDCAHIVSDTMIFEATESNACITIIEQTWSRLFGCSLTPPTNMQYRDGQPLHLAFCKTLFAHPLGDTMVIDPSDGQFPTDFVERVKARFAEGDKRSQQFLHQLNQLRSNIITDADGLNQDARRYLTGAKVYARYRRVFVTRDGRLGLGPRAMRIGDEIVVLFGGQAPYVLRRKGNHHLFVGQCYVLDDEIMHGKWTENVRVHNTGPRRTTFFLK